MGLPGGLVSWRNVWRTGQGKMARARGLGAGLARMPGTKGTPNFWFPRTALENEAMPTRTEPETAILLTQIATAREALRQIRDLAVEPGADPWQRCWKPSGLLMRRSHLECGQCQHIETMVIAFA